MSRKRVAPLPEDVDLPMLGRALWRAKRWILGLALGAGAITFIGLSMARPLYTSESRVLIENDVSAYTRPAADQGRDQLQTLDEQAVQSQVQVVTSRDLALDVTETLDLSNNPEFAKDAGVSLFKRLLNRIGFGRGSDKSEQEKAADAFEDHLSVYALNKSSVIAIDYTSGDPSLAAEAANKLAEAYINWQRQAKLEQTKDATTWLNAQIEALRTKVSESEAAVERFRASSGLYAGSNNVTLNAQQLSELNSQLILAAAQKSEAEARARLIKKMLNDNGDIDATPEVLKSELIARLIEQRVQVQRQVAELSATLLPSHPRIKQLSSELADVRTQIREEANKIVRGLENESEVASARETSLRNSLNDVKSQASGQSESEIKLRALEREAKANRDLLESYLARYQDAASRHDMGAVPANATVVSRAHASTKPSFPKTGPVTLLVTAATALLALAFVLARELIGSTAGAAAPLRESEPLLKRPRPARTAGTAAPAVPPMTSPAAPELPLAAPPAHAAATTNRDRVARPAAAEPASRPRDRDGVTEPVVEQRPAFESFIDRLRKALPAAPNEVAEPRTTAPRTSRSGPDPVTGQPNDLRRYLQQRAASPGPTNPVKKPDTEAPRAAKVGPLLKSLDAILNHIAARNGNGAARTILVAPVAARTQSTGEAIQLARALAAKRQRVVLVDLTRSASSVSGQLGLPRAPGLTDLAAGRASFEDVVHVDAQTPLQVIPAGNPTVRANGDEARRLVRIFDALSQAYDCVVLQADAETVHKLESVLAGRVQVVVAVVSPGADPRQSEQRMAELASLGGHVLGYEQTGRQTHPSRPGLLERVAAAI